MNLQILLMLRKGDILHVNVCIFLCVFINVCEHVSVNKCQQCFLWFTISQVGRLLCQGFHDPMLCTARGPWHSDFYKLLLDARFLITNDILESKLRYFWVGKQKSEVFNILKVHRKLMKDILNLKIETVRFNINLNPKLLCFVQWASKAWQK